MASGRLRFGSPPCPVRGYGIGSGGVPRLAGTRGRQVATATAHWDPGPDRRTRNRRRAGRSGPGSRLTSDALKNGPAPSTSPERHRPAPLAGTACAASSRLWLSRISSTPLSLSTAGFELGAVVGDQARDLVAGHRGEVVHQRVNRVLLGQQFGQKRIGVVTTRSAIWSLRLASTPVTLLALANRLRSWWSRALRVSENRPTPSSASFRSGGVSRNVSPRVVSAEDNRGGVQSADRGGQIPERGRQVVGRGGPFDGDRCGESAVA